ncbi:hypothetical protein J1N35_044611 [Gossypium stocksii]|uniref:Uncharacterized protein n=1 Tax=Gossypium stocksii TaxID=47602 RepID=A0A9D3ZGF6_9ROSI|nr:hypothetical protein J1N35_044611 [Gossypium stocksii]
MIRLGDKHISGVQLQIAKDRIMETYTYNLSKSASVAIYGHLRDARFLYVTRMLGRTKLDPHLSILWWKDGDQRHTYSIFPAVSVQLRSWMLVYNSVYRPMGKSLRGQ